MKIFQKLSNNSDSSSLANSLRKRRFEFFNSLFSKIAQSNGKKVKILDLGGTQMFWEQMGFDQNENCSIHILNLSPEEVHLSKNGNQPLTEFVPVIGDACNLSQYEDQTFDIVFSNSVIEHVGSWENQERMIKEASRVGKRYFIQTPNYYFPVEPHFHFIGFQFLPFNWRVKLVQSYNLGWFTKKPEREAAEELVNSYQLLSKTQLKKLDPDANIYNEKFLGMNKSFIMYKGWS